MWVESRHDQGRETTSQTVNLGCAATDGLGDVFCRRGRAPIPSAMSAATALHGASMQRSDTSRRSLRVLVILMSLSAAGCAAYGGATLLDVPTELNAPAGVVLRSPDAIRTPTGMRFHGTVCRQWPMQSPTRIRVERISATGEILASASRPIWGLGGRGRRCSFYDVPTDWTVGAHERVRVCAPRSDTPCAPRPNPASQPASREHDPGGEAPS